MMTEIESGVWGLGVIVKRVRRNRRMMEKTKVLHQFKKF